MILIIVNGVFLAAELLLLARVALSWIWTGKKNAVADVIYRITDPPVLLCREIIHSIGKMTGFDPRGLPVDLSPALALLLMDFVLRRVVLMVLRAFM